MIGLTGFTLLVIVVAITAGALASRRDNHCSGGCECCLNQQSETEHPIV